MDDILLTKIFKTHRPEVIAARLNMAASTIWRWRAGKSRPSRLAEEKIRQIFFKELSEQNQ